MPQLDSLPRIVYPCKIDVERCLHNPEYNGNRIRLPLVCIEFPDNPIQDVESAIGTEGEEVVGIDHRGHGRLSQEKELRQDTD